VPTARDSQSYWKQLHRFRNHSISSWSTTRAGCLGILATRINTALIEALNSVEKRAAIETGQEQENIQVTGQVTSKAIALSKVMTIPELEELERKMLAEIEKDKAAGKVIEAQK